MVPNFIDPRQLCLLEEFLCQIKLDLSMYLGRNECSSFEGSKSETAAFKYPLFEVIF